MQSNSNAALTKSSPVGCSPIVFVLVIAFAFFTLYCSYSGAPTKEIDNDVVVVTGFIVSAALGALVGLILYVVPLLRSRHISNKAGTQVLN